MVRKSLGGAAARAAGDHLGRLCEETLARRAAVVALALKPGSSILFLKVHLWLVPVKSLAADSALDLSGQVSLT